MPACARAAEHGSAASAHALAPHLRYDKSAMGDVEKALMISDLGMTPSNDGKLIRLNVPQLTEDRRKELAKQAKGFGEDGKVAIRNVRRDAIEKIKKMQKVCVPHHSRTTQRAPARPPTRPSLTRGALAQDGMGEDESKDLQEEVQKALKKFEGEVDKAVAQREKDIMTI